MESRNKFIDLVVLPLVIFSFAYSLRRYFFSGFILGDNYVELAMNLRIITNGPFLQDQLHQRFSVWLFNSLFFKLFGVSETTFFLPTWLMSASLSAIGYYILLAWRYRPSHAFLAGLLVASAPFEVFIGSTYSNDLILSWLLALGMFCFVIFERMPVLQGASVAFFCWLGFYVKLWAVYVFPSLALYYFIRIRKTGIWSGLIALCLASFLLHGIMSIFWKIKLGLFFPFLSYHPGTFPVPASDLGRIFLEYPKMIFLGSEFGTTLFGFVPYTLIFLLLIKMAASFSSQKVRASLQFDRPDIYLLIYYSSYFFLMNFYPHSLKVDHYYSTTRIFRYLAPISFLMTLHLAKLILDIFVVNFHDVKAGAIARYAAILVFVFLIPINIYQANDATKPGQIYRRALLSILNDVKEQSPPQLLAEERLGFFLREVYLKAERNKIVLLPIFNTYKAEDYEDWLEKNQPNLPTGTMMITGLGNYVYYGAYWDGFRLRQFGGNLDPHWKLFKEYGIQSYLPLPEPARLWRLSSKINAPKKIRPNPSVQFEQAMAFFSGGQYSKARSILSQIIERYPHVQNSDSGSRFYSSANYFYAISYFKQNNYQQTIDAFTELIRYYPNSPLVPEAYFHIGLSQRALNQLDQAKATYRFLIQEYSTSDWAKFAQVRLKELEKL